MTDTDPRPRLGGLVSAEAEVLRLQLETRSRELVEDQRRLFAGWHRLSVMVAARTGDVVDTTADGLRMCARPEDVVIRTAEFYAGATRHVRAVDTGILDLPRESTAGVVRQVLCQADHPAAAERVMAGDQVRLRDRLPVTMVHVDDSAALVVLDRTASTAVVVTAPALLEMLAGWFDLLWRHPATMTFPPGGTERALTKPQRDVLKLMLGGGGDEAIARRLGLSVSTVRRTIKSIYDLLGVNNRFAVGVAAAKQNWI
jgi:DNA-binding NarL/FixJ family response regulator